MQLQFKEQQFQLNAVQAVVDCFAGQKKETTHFTLERSKDLLRQAEIVASGGGEQVGLELAESIGYRNRPLQISEQQFLQNIKDVQARNEILKSEKLERPAKAKHGYNLTIEMETGTGKTYTYIRTMYELHEQYGWSKFIIVVPSIAIREGAFKSFEVTQNHFQEIFGHKISPFIYNSSRPQDIESFASDSRISVMIINTQAFNAKGKDARRIYMELDQFGTRRPIEIISQTNPILIIDEPQSVDGEKTLEGMQDFNPLFTLRYSATHKVEYNKVFRLDALDAYNNKLVKKIQVKGINLKGFTGTTGYLYLEGIIISPTKSPLALIEYEKRSGQQVKRVRERLAEGANLFQLSGEMPQYKNYVVKNIDGYHNKIEINGKELFASEAIGNVDEKALRRIQIRETIISHLEKEKQLFDQGIKVLSLFFIDSVEKYKTYNAQGEEEPGEYAKLFEEEYNLVRSDYIDLFNQEYNDFLETSDPGNSHKGYMPTDYQKYLERDNAAHVHNGYFSIDKKNKLVNPETKKAKKGEEAESDDITAYELIMKDKERLLSFSEPTRFLFSHSALKEGWDNPNVFQICALKNSDAIIRRRQEVGRGMRLCVNDRGVRLDYETIGDAVHEVNKLTVIASESYESFAKGLQQEIADTLKDRPKKADVGFFTGKLLVNNEGLQMRLNESEALKLNKFLYKKEILDDDDRITIEGREKIERNTVPLPEHLETFRTSIVKILKSIYSSEALHIENANAGLTISVNRNFARDEFQKLWNKINIKTIYEVRFDTEKLIADSKNKINAELSISERTYEVKSGELERTTTKEHLENLESFKQTSRTTKKLNTPVDTNTRYDLIGEIVTLTNLTRSTVVEILKKIHPQKFVLFQKNPEEFIARTSKFMNEVKASLIYNNIVYHKTEERHDAKTVFTNTKSVLRQSELLKKHIYDYLTTDSKIENTFAKQLEDATEVTVYAKLPKSFYVTTPIANYSPDWAIVFDKEHVRHIYFVAETKGSESDLELREIEKLKLHCAEKHFQEISGLEVHFAKISTYEKLLELVDLH
jgi:type III restriction enzyme